MTIKNKVQELAIYQAKNGSIELSVDYKKDTIWASIDEIAFLFDINKSNVSRHIQNIFAEKELIKDSTVAKSATVRKKEGDREAKRRIEYITQGFTINKNIIDKNRQEFLKAVEDIKLLTNINPGSILLTIVIQLYYYIDIIINSKNMRQVLSLSLPQQTTIEIKKSAKQRGFASVSGYIKYLFDLDQDLISETELLNSIKSARQEYKEGRAIKAKSLIDLL